MVWTVHYFVYEGDVSGKKLDLFDSSFIQF